jgi:DNA-binding transcriptional MerR regulator
MRIDDLARQTGVATSTVRYHEEIGLLPPAARSENGYRVYTQTDVERLRFIQRAKVLDISIAVIREILGLHERD